MAAAKKILVVDDDPRVVRLLLMNLQRAGYLMDHAFDGREALARITEHMPDMIVLDICMPHMTGLEMLQALRAHDATKNLPVILLTAHSSDRDLYAGYHTGANIYLTKPVNPKVLLRYIRQLFDDIAKAEKPDDMFHI